MRDRYRTPKSRMTVTNRTNTISDVWEEGGTTSREKRAVRRQFKAKERTAARSHIANELRALTD